MAVAPTLAILTGISEFEMRYRIGFPSSMRLSPALIAGTPVHFGGRIDGGMDFGSSREHSVTLTAESDWAAKTELPVEDYAPDKAYRFTRYIGGEYDYYNRGNIAYAGVSRKVPYLGYTWAWTSVRLGLITSPLSRFIPLPYIYWRF